MSKGEILITGASGFIGSATTKALQKQGNKVKMFKGDIVKVSDWKKNLKGDETIFLIAGVRTETKKDFKVNAGGVERLFYALNRTNKLPNKVILASSQAVYMGNKTPFKESQKPTPTTIYGKSKLLAERIAERWSHKLDIPLVILRYSTVLGRGVREKSKMSGPLFIWTKIVIAGEPINIFQDGKQTRDYLNVSDVVSANLMAINLPAGIYNVGGAEPIQLLDLANWVKKAAKSKSEIVILGGNPDKDDPGEMFSDTSKIRSYGWKPGNTAKEAVEDYVISKLIRRTS
jgi:nucleoside-diphosphate-sugar epimerase